MPRSRKTVDIYEMVEKLNEYYETCTDDVLPSMAAVETFVTAFLFKTNNYHGFGYINAEQTRKRYYLPR